MLDLTPDPKDLEPIEKAPVKQLRELQLERMKWSIAHTYKNQANYQEKCDKAGVHPDQLKTLEDLARFPFTVKTDLRDTYPFGMFCVPMDQIRRIHASSGTTGKPIVAGYTANDIEMWSTVVARSLRAAGVKPGMKVHNAYGYGLFTGGLGLHYGTEKLGAAIIPMGGGQTEKQLQLITDFEPDVIVVTPSYMMTILDEMERHGIDPAKTSLKVGVFGAEPWTEDMRREMEGKLDMHAVDIYGLTEVVGPGVGNECVETKDGITIWEDHFYPEIIDPDTGEVLPDGEQGELVFTTITKEAFPVIRYRTRDITRLLPGTARSMRRVEKITGRSDDMIILRGVNMFPSQVEEVLMSIPGLTAFYYLKLYNKGRMDGCDVYVEARPEPAESDYHTLGEQAMRRIKEVVGVTLGMHVLPPGSIERSIGKAKHLIDERKK